MMNRREFLRASALVTAGVIAADQLEILDRLAPRRLFAGADFGGRRWVFDKDTSTVTRSFSEADIQQVLRDHWQQVRVSLRDNDYIVLANPS